MTQRKYWWRLARTGKNNFKGDGLGFVNGDMLEKTIGDALNNADGEVNGDLLGLEVKIS